MRSRRANAFPRLGDDPRPLTLNLVTHERRRPGGPVFDRLAVALLEGSLPPGSTLPPERELSERFGCHDSSFREAVHRLADMGLVRAKQRGENRGRSSERCPGSPRDRDGFVRKALFCRARGGHGQPLLHPETSWWFKLTEVRPSRAPGFQRRAASGPRRTNRAACTSRTPARQVLDVPQSIRGRGGVGSSLPAKNTASQR